MNDTNVELLTKILEIADQHPNTNLSKLIKCFEADRKTKNIALLLTELAEHAIYASDISISLGYYLDTLENLNEEPTFSEAGLIVFNSAIIYGKRVDEVQHSVERLLFSLGDINPSDAEKSHSEPNATLKKRSRKRPLEHVNGIYEAEMNIKRFKTISDKRFDENTLSNKKLTRNNTISEAAGLSDFACFDKQWVHPTSWRNSVIRDFEYDEETDSKNNYKLFTLHLEHRYNTVIPDINLKMYFKMKDFMDAECTDPTIPESWPALSDAYIEQYVNVEDQILFKEGIALRRMCQLDKVITLESAGACACQAAKTTNMQLIEEIECLERNIHKLNSSFNLLDQQTRDISEKNIVSDVSQKCFLDSHNFENEMDNTETQMNSEESGISPSVEKESTCFDKDLEIVKSPVEDDFTVKLQIPHTNERDLFSSLSLTDQQLTTLSADVVIKEDIADKNDKENKVDEEIKRLFRLREPRNEILSLPYYIRDELSLTLNILKIPLVYLRKRCKFKLGIEFNLRKKERLKKYIRRSTVIRSISWACFSKSVIGVYTSPPSSPSHDPVFLGFSEETYNHKRRTLSRDSGISLHNTDKEMIEDFTEPRSPILNSLLNLASDTPVEKDFSVEKTPVGHENINDSADEESPVCDNLEKPIFVLTNVQKWFSHLQPILTQSRDRHHFNVFELGTEVMSEITDGQTSFQDVMATKEKCNISRYFLSSLLLVNQGNIEIEVLNRDSNFPSNLEDVRFKVKSLTRYKAALENEISVPILPTPSSKHIDKEPPSNTVVKTLKCVPVACRVDDRDSGIDMLDGSISFD